MARTGPSSAVKVTRSRPSSVGSTSVTPATQGRPSASAARNGTVPLPPGPPRSPSSRTSPPSRSRAGGDERCRRGRREVESAVRDGIAEVHASGLEPQRLQGGQERAGLAASDGERREARLEAERRARVAYTERELQRGLVEHAEHAAHVAGGLGAALRALGRGHPRPVRGAQRLEVRRDLEADGDPHPRSSSGGAAAAAGRRRPSARRPQAGAPPRVRPGRSSPCS